MTQWKSIQWLRGIAVLGVLFFHLSAAEKKYCTGTRLIPSGADYGQCGVDLFFLISGFIIVSSTRKIQSSPASKLKFLWNRFTRIYPYYWVFFAIAFVLYKTKPSWINSSLKSPPDFISSFFLLPSASLPIVMVAWSLILEIWFYLVFSLLLGLRTRALIISFALWGALCFAYNLGFANSSISSPLLDVIGSPFTIEFITGGAIAIYCINANSESRSLTTRLFVLFATIIAGYILTQAFNPLQSPGGLYRTVFFSVFLGSILLQSILIDKFSKPINMPYLKLVGDASYSIYLSHVLSISAIGRIYLAAPIPKASSSNAIALILMSTSALSLGILLHHFVEKPIIHFFRETLVVFWGRKIHPHH
jgi:exopolysaccharide production protein ExoZ